MVLIMHQRILSPESNKKETKNFAYVNLVVGIKKKVETNKQNKIRRNSIRTKFPRVLGGEKKTEIISAQLDEQGR